jgi:two-component system, LytTR family, sensor kinase
MDRAIPDAEPTPRNRTWLVWAISFAVWMFLSFAAAGTVYEIYSSTMKTSFKETIFLQSSELLTFAPLTPFVFALAVRYPIQRRNWMRRSVLHLAFALIFSALHVTMRALTPYAVWDQQLHRWASPIWDAGTHALRVQWPKLRTLYVSSVFDDITDAYVPVVFIGYAVSYYQRLREREIRTSELEIQLAKSHLQVLKSQLQPHFLFNTLHSISALMLIDVRAADKMMTRLSDLLRMTLDSNATQITTLSHELEFVAGYLEIEKVRLQERLSVVLDIAPDTLDAQVPSLLLQPLVENAVKHGISQQSDGGEIHITASHDGRNLYLNITNSGPGLGDAGSVAKQGVGLRATRERLSALYGSEQNLDIRELPHRGVEVCVRIPFYCDPRLVMYESTPEDMGAPTGDSSDGA